MCRRSITRPWTASPSARPTSPAACVSPATSRRGGVVTSTGDGLPGGAWPWARAKTRAANRHALLAAVRECGFEAVDGGIVGDSEEDLEKAVRAAVADADALVTSGGVSVGDYD